VRDIALALIIAGLMLLALKRPWIGALAWVWVSSMSPHRMAFGFMVEAPVAQVVALALLAGLLFSKEHKSFPNAVPIKLMIVFTAWMCIGFPFSIVDSKENYYQLEKVLKIMVLNLVILVPLYTRKHVDYLIATVAASIGFFGVKGGVFALMTGGAYQVRGGGGFIEPNNELALALIMVIPLILYFALSAKRRWLQYGLFGVIFLTSVAAVSSQSRGALVAILAMWAAFLIRSTNRWRVFVPTLLTAIFIAAFMPDTWWTRMGTIATFETDGSALGRINAWQVSWNVATHHFFGGGFYLEDQSVFNRFAPDPTFIAVAHSIYFQILGHHGFVGLAIYLLMWFFTLRTCSWVYRNSSSAEDKQLARMAEISLVGFATGGAFLSLAYYDAPYYIMIAMVILRYKVMQNKPAVSAAAGSAQRSAPVPGRLN